MDPRDPQRLIALGRVVDAWGVGGWIKVEPYAGPDDTTMTRVRTWRLTRAASPGHAAVDLDVQIERARRHASTVVAKAAGCDDRDAALAFKGAEVGVRRVEFPSLPDGEHYWIDLVGCAVTNAGGQSLGTVTRVDDHGAHPILETDAGQLIPFVDAYVLEAAPDHGRIVVDWHADWSR